MENVLVIKDEDSGELMGMYDTSNTTEELPLPTDFGTFEDFEEELMEMGVQEVRFDVWKF